MANPILSAAATNTQVDDDNLNPTQAVSSGANGRHVVHVTLVFDGVDFIPNDLYDALDAEYGTVAYEKDVATRGTYIFNIST